MSEFWPPAPIEHEPNPELSSQQQYVQGLWGFVGTIPDLTQFSDFWVPRDEDETFLSAYCQAEAYRRTGAAEAFPPLHREDIIDPSFCEQIEKVPQKITGEHPSYHWYSQKGREHGRSSDRNAAYLSRKWEQFYIPYMRERRIFHAHFMTSLLSGEPIDEHLSTLGTRNGKPVTMPSARLGSYENQPAASFLYDKDNWLASSVLSALALPPEQCSASMKRRAIELWDQHADLTNDESLDSFYFGDRFTHVIRLPWSMRDNDELRVNHHLAWRRNRIIKQYFGEPGQPRADGLSTFLQERPKDYVQILLLNLFEHGGPARGLEALTYVAALSDQIKDIIFADDASFNTIYYPATPDSLSDPLPLAALLEGHMEASTQEELLGGLALRVRVLEDKLTNAQELATKNGEAAKQWEGLYRQLHAAVLNGQVTITRSPVDTLMMNYGIHPETDNDTLQLLVRAHRRRANRAGHSDTNQDPEALEQTKEVNAELDAILRHRGLTNTEHRE